MSIERITQEQVLIVVLAVVAAVCLGWVIVAQTGGTLKAESNWKETCSPSGFRIFELTGQIAVVADEHCKLSVNQGGAR